MDIKIRQVEIIFIRINELDTHCVIHDRQGVFFNEFIFKKLTDWIYLKFDT